MNEQNKFNADSPQHEVPAAALCLDATVELGERSSDDTKTSPVRMRARTGDAIDHWYWGRVVHDLDGFELSGDKSKVALLYDHHEPIGYALKKNISTESGDLELSGTLVETRNNNRATDVIDWMAAGVPFEASISFAGGTPKLEVLDKGAKAEVNGKTFEGPGVVVRQWKLREVSVVTSGADDGTETTLLSNSDSVPIQILEQECPAMATDKLTAAEVEDVTVDEAVEATDNDTAEDTVDSPESVDATPEETRTEPDKDTELSARASAGKTFMDLFGPVQGALYFAEGLSLQAAKDKELARLRDENSELRTKKTADDDGLDDAVGFSTGDKTTNILSEVPGANVADVTDWKGMK